MQWSFEGAGEPGGAVSGQGVRRVSGQRASSQGRSRNVLCDSLLGRSGTAPPHKCCSYPSPPTFLDEWCQRTYVLLLLCKLCLCLLQCKLLLFIAQSEFLVRRGGYEWRVVGHDRLDIFVLGFLLQILKFKLAEERLAGLSSASRPPGWNWAQTV